VIAYKFLRAGRIGPFSGYRWPEAGTWVEAVAPLDVCVSGIHACRPEGLPAWLDEVLWRVELDGQTVEQDGVVVALRGRLLEAVEGWSRDVSRQLAEDAAERVEARADAVQVSFAEDVRRAAGRADIGSHAFAAFAAAYAAERAEPGGFEAERALQAAWLRRRLSL
jgi:hypothetical protein